MKENVDVRDIARSPLVVTLRRLGFTDIEARTYEALVRSQPATAYEVAKRAGLPRANVYNAVSVLLSRGALQPVTKSPVRYRVAEPESFFRQLSADTSRNAELAITEMERLAPHDETPFVSHVRGHDALLQQLALGFGGAQEHIFVKTTDALASPLFNDLAAAAGRGVQVTIVASGSEWTSLQGISNLTLVPHEGTWSTPSRPHELLFTTTIDTDAMILAAFGSQPYGYVASNGGLVYVIQTMILHEVYLAEIHRAVGPDRLKAWGVSFDALRARFRPQGIDRRLLTQPKD